MESLTVTETAFKVLEVIESDMVRLSSITSR